MATRNARRAPQLEPAARRAQLLDCAMAAFAERGIGGAGHAQVAARAGVSTPTVFAYFPTRQDLTREVLLDVHRRATALIREGLAGPGSPRRRLAALLAATEDQVRADPATMRVYLDWVTSCDAAAQALFRTLLVETLGLYGAYATAAIAAGELPPTADAQDLGHFIFGTCHMIVQMTFLDSPPGRIARYREMMLASLMPAG